MYSRIVIKVGTNVLTDNKGGLDHTRIGHLVEQIAAIRRMGCEVIVVTSGAVGAGRAIMGGDIATETIADKQVYAAVGQVALMNVYTEHLAHHGIRSAQILVTKEDFRDRVHYRNMETCFLNVLRDNVVPIVNENDVVAVKELIFTDNDELAGLVALQLDVDAVCILSSVEGVIAGDISDPHAHVIPEIRHDALRSAEAYVTADTSGGGRGGMLTKFAMARKMVSAGITVYILNGKRDGCVLDIFGGEPRGTQFVPHKKVSSRKRRIAHGDSLAAGTIVVNRGVVGQIFSDKHVLSLLPVGIVSASGDFKKGDMVKVAGPEGKVIGCGIVKTDTATVIALAGQKGGKAVIHYNDLFIY